MYCCKAFETNPRNGAPLTETWRAVSDGFPVSNGRANSPHFSKSSTCRASPINTFSPIGRVRLGRESHPLSASSRLCLVRTFSLLLTLSSTLEGTWQKAGRYQRTGLTWHRSERLQFWSVLISVNSSFVSHRSFKAQMLHLHCFEEISAAAI